MKSCNNCTALGKECAVEPDDRARSAENCPGYQSIDDVWERRWRRYLATGESWEDD